MPRTISATFAAQLRRGYQLASFVEVWGPGGLLADSDDFKVVSGRIVVDGSASIQRRLEGLMIAADADSNLVPNAATDLFSVVSSNELRVYTGMVNPNTGVAELLLQGIFGLEGAEVSDTDGGLIITLSAYDRAQTVSRAKLVVAQKLSASNPPTTTAFTTATALIAAARPGTQVKVIGGVDPQFGHPEIILDEGTDPWEAARQIIADVGWELMMDWDGQALLRPVIDPNSASLTSSWTFAEGTEATLLGLVRGFTNAEAFNIQVVTGESTGNAAPARGIAYDTDPTSPTWYQGPYGSVPEFYTSELIRTDAQAAAVALARLNQRKGANEMMQFSIVPNHALEYGDVVTITRTKSKVNRTYIVEGFTLGLSALEGPMSITTRQRKA